MGTSGFGPFDIGKVAVYTLDGKVTTLNALIPNLKMSITNILLQRTNNGSSLLTIQITDPERTILRSGQIKQGISIKVENISYTLTQYVKASDQAQLVFESTTIYMLRNFGRGVKKVGGLGPQFVTPFMKSLVQEINAAHPRMQPIGFFGPDYATTLNILSARDTKKIYYTAEAMAQVKNFQVGRGAGGGSSVDPNEDSWTCMARIASSIGWRLWESDNTIFFGPDEFWLGENYLAPVLPKGSNSTNPPINNRYRARLTPKIQTIQEFTRRVQLIDFDWNVNKSLAMATVTVMMDGFDFNIGEVVSLSGVGIASGKWIVGSMQRNMFLPTAAMNLMVPIPTGQLITPTSLPESPFPLQ